MQASFEVMQEYSKALDLNGGSGTGERSRCSQTSGIKWERRFVRLESSQE